MCRHPLCVRVRTACMNIDECEYDSFVTFSPSITLVAGLVWNVLYDVTLFPNDICWVFMRNACNCMSSSITLFVNESDDEARLGINWVKAITTEQPQRYVLQSK